MITHVACIVVRGAAVNSLPGSVGFGVAKSASGKGPTCHYRKMAFLPNQLCISDGLMVQFIYIMY